MKKRIIGYLGFVPLLFFLCLPPVSAETGYVSDMLLLTLRAGPGNEFSVLKTLTSNTPVEIIEKGELFFKVNTKDGQEGWVQKQYITFDLPLPLVIAQMKKRIAELETANKNLVESQSPLMESMETKKKHYEERITMLDTSLKQAVKEKNGLASSLDQIRKKHDQFLKQSADTVRIVDENRVLEEENTRLSAELARFEEESNDFLKTAMMKWFLAGAGVLIAGWLIGRSVGGGRRSSRL
ncbi:MAG: TIGR04211 family SH3 domain-containing protein [Desulfobacterium sp.]|nr:TIGR04211 family SH3 domain-containing protein [Desulfobacterium sp.]